MVVDGEGMLFRTNDSRGRAAHGKVVAKAILLATFQGCILPHLKMPMYLWCSAFDKIYDWYSDDNIWAELAAYVPQHILGKVNHLRYGQAGNDKKVAGTVGWDDWGAYMHPKHFNETNSRKVQDLMILYPCAGCGNIDGDPLFHGGVLEDKCGCGIPDAFTPTGCARQATNLAELHHCFTEYMNFRVMQNRPAAISLVGEMRELLMPTTGHEHSWSGIMKHVFAQMKLEYLIRFATGGAKKLELYRNVHVQTRFPSRLLADNSALEGTVWSKKRPQSSNMQVKKKTRTMSQNTTGLTLIEGTGFASVQSVRRKKGAGRRGTNKVLSSPGRAHDPRKRVIKHPPSSSATGLTQEVDDVMITNTEDLCDPNLEFYKDKPQRSRSRSETPPGSPSGFGSEEEITEPEPSKEAEVVAASNDQPMDYAKVVKGHKGGSQWPALSKARDKKAMPVE